jgi:hypothetical protein
MFTLTKKTWKYIFYAVIGLIVIYVLFQSTRERFTSVNPLPTVEDFAALESVINKETEEARKTQLSEPKLGAAILKSAPESFKAIVRFSRANIIPLLPYSIMTANTRPDGDMFDFYILIFTGHSKDLIVLPLAYAVKQQTSPPTLPAFIDMVIKVMKDSNPRMQIDAETQKIIDEMKKGEPTFSLQGTDTFPNPGYWAYKYIYGEPNAAPSASASASTSTSSGGVGSPTKCTPSIRQIPGGITEVRCFND